MYIPRLIKDNAVNLGVDCCFWLLNKEANFHQQHFASVTRLGTFFVM